MRSDKTLDPPSPAVRRMLDAAGADLPPRPEPAATSETHDDPLVHRLLAGVLTHDREFRQLGRIAWAGPRDFLITHAAQLRAPEETFARLRLGGQIFIVAHQPAGLHAAAADYEQRGFVIQTPPRRLPRRFLGLDVARIAPAGWYCALRKTHLLLPRDFSDRFTYSVRLDRFGSPAQWAIVKEVPTEQRVFARLRHKFPDAPDDLILRRARKFTQKIFPLFLTREAAILNILQRDLPVNFRERVPRALHVEKDERGFVQRLVMNWMRLAAQPLAQIEFARQAASLLDAIHQSVGIMHLDLRLDNMLITEQGVCFVDFGSAVRVGENLAGNPLLNTLFDELMRTSQIQRMLEKMTLSGHVTSRDIQQAYGRVDKQVDLFYLAVQICTPHANPDLADLILYNPDSPEASLLSQLSEQVLRPLDPQHPTFRTAHDLLQGICAIHDRLRRMGQPAEHRVRR